MSGAIDDQIREWSKLAKLFHNDLFTQLVSIKAQEIDLRVLVLPGYTGLNCKASSPKNATDAQ